MNTSRRLAGALVALLALGGLAGLAGPVAAGAVTAPAGAQASAQSTARAVVVVDLGTLGGGVRTSVIAFDGSVNGIDALQLAGASPETIDYGALGQAVCSLYGAGDAAVPDQCPGGWQYFRAVGGAGSWTKSGLGPSSTSVHDGDVEGWRYGGGAPPFQSFCAVAGCPTDPPPDTTPAVTTPAGGVVGQGSGSQSGAGQSGTDPGTDGSPGPPNGTATTSTSVPGLGISGHGSPTTTAAGRGKVDRATDSGGRRGDATLAAGIGTGSGGGGGGGSPIGVVVALVVVGALVGTGVLVRRRRAAGGPGQ